MTREVRQTDVLPDGASLEWPRPEYDRSWTDDGGTTWRMRGGELHAKVAGRLLRRPVVVVLHADGCRVAPVEGTRTALLHRVEEFLMGKASDFSVFALGDFGDADRRVMLVVEESC